MNKFNKIFNFQIVKIDTYTGNVKIWSEFDAFPSEPVFVAAEDGKVKLFIFIIYLLFFSLIC